MAVRAFVEVVHASRHSVKPTLGMNQVNISRRLLDDLASTLLQRFHLLDDDLELRVGTEGDFR